MASRRIGCRKKQSAADRLLAADVGPQDLKALWILADVMESRFTVILVNGRHLKHVPGRISLG